MELKNKKVLLVGLGTLGGGAATAKFLVDNGAILTVTDLKDKANLSPSLEKLKDIGVKIKFVLGEHREKDFLENDIIVINPDVPANNRFVNLAREHGNQIENELTLFYKFSKSKNIIAVTGTRGKTTVTNWVYHFIKSQNPNTVLLGNSPGKPFLQEIAEVNEKSIVVIEVPSYHLEIVNDTNFRPKIAVITNIYRDHINRHKSMEEYAAAKANIFVGQGADDILILNKENKWTDFFLDLKPKAKVLFFSKTDLPEFAKAWGEHNLENLLAASLAAQSVGVSEENIKKSIATLPQIKYREEKVYDKEGLQIYNDSAATSPEAAMAAIQRFKDAVFICGGTDKELDFGGWAATVRTQISPMQLILLSGSATEKMKKALGWEKFNEFDSLEECFNKALEITEQTPASLKLPTSLKLCRTSRGTRKIVFSPGAKSFEKFKNEFDRGEKFNDLVIRLPEALSQG